jgi:hypothetical protein
MDFPSYVPEGAQKHTLEALRIFETSLAELRQCQSPENKSRDGLQKRLDDLERDIAAIKRLALDERMKDAYGILTEAFFGGEDSERQDKFWSFLYAAWSANMDYSPYRENLKKQAKLRDEIAETAAKLASLLEKIGETGGGDLPDEFTQVRSLLRNTDNHKNDDYDFRMWRVSRDFVLGEKPPDERTEAEKEAEIREGGEEEKGEKLAAQERRESEIAERERSTLRYAWQQCPPLSELLRTLSKAARDFKPSEYGTIGAAIDSRKKNEKTEYLRAFGELLTSQNRFSLTPEIIKAMAITANVVINSPDVDVSYDDVRKALSALIPAQKESKTIAAAIPATGSGTAPPHVRPFEPSEEEKQAIIAAFESCAAEMGEPAEKGGDSLEDSAKE